MRWSRLPSVTALRAFAALAQTGSLSSAGRLLNVSHAAIGQQLRALEAALGTSLAHRAGRGIELTPKGAELAEVLTRSFSQIADVVDRITGAEAVRPVHVSLTPSFAARWLMPRLADFQHRHPGVELMLNPTPDLVDLRTNDIDLAIRYGDGPWRGLTSTLLIETPRIMVGARSLVGATPPPVETLHALPWLQELGTTEVADWLTAQGITEGKVAQLTHLPGNLMLDGLRRGHGIAATTRLFVEDDVASGRLTVLHEQVGAGYHLVHRPGVQRASVKAFATWLRRMARVETATTGTNRPKGT